MSLLREIQDAAIDGSSDLETLLRKCRLLASRLKYDAFKDWVIWELDGYPEEVNLPSYRVFHGKCHGHFSGAFGSGIQNAPIPVSSIPADWRDLLTMYEFREGIGSLVHMSQMKKHLRFEWPADCYPLFHYNVYPQFGLTQAWIDIPTAIMASIQNEDSPSSLY